MIFNAEIYYPKGYQMAEVMVSRKLFQEILERIHRLKPVLIGSVLYFGNLNFDIV